MKIVKRPAGPVHRAATNVSALRASQSWSALDSFPGPDGTGLLPVGPSTLKTKSLKGEFTRTISPARALAAESLALDRQLDGLVNEAYGSRPKKCN